MFADAGPPRRIGRAGAPPRRTSLAVRQHSTSRAGLTDKVDCPVRGRKDAFTTFRMPVIERGSAAEEPAMDIWALVWPSVGTSVCEARGR